MAKTNGIVEQTALNQINTGTKIEGNIISNGNLRIDGDVVGRIESKGKVVLGASCHITGDIICANADIEGTVNGNVIVSEKTVLRATCLLEGNIQTGSLSVEPGARFNGKCQMGTTENLKTNGVALEAVGA